MTDILLSAGIPNISESAIAELLPKRSKNHKHIGSGCPNDLYGPYQ